MFENQNLSAETNGLIGSTIRDLMAKPYASRAAKLALSQQLLKIAGSFDSDADAKRQRDEEHMKLFNRALRNGTKLWNQRDLEQFNRFQIERRDMSDTAPSGAYPASTNGFFVPMAFEEMVWQMLAATDKLFDESFVTFLRSDNARPLSQPQLDNTSSAAVVRPQGQAITIAEPPIIGQLSFPTASSWTSNMWRISRSLLEDNAVDIPGLFAATSAVRFRRGIGKANVATLLNAATLGWEAIGSSTTDGTGGPETCGIDNLHSLLASVNAEYLASPKAAWLMNFSTYQSLLQVKDMQKRPVLVEQYDADGNPLLFGKRVAICPSMPSMSSTTSSPQLTRTPIAVGDLGRFLVRVAGGMRIVRADERFAEYFQIGFESFVRTDALLNVTTGSDSPIKYLTTAA